MALIPVGKGDFRLLPRFAEQDFPGYELYLTEFNEHVHDSLKALPGHVKIISIHQPPSVRIAGQLYPSNLADPGPVGVATLAAMKEIIRLCTQQGISQVVVHGAFHDCRERTRQESFSLLAQRLKSLSRSEVTLLCETDALWGAKYFPTRTLLCTLEDFLLLMALMEGSIKITLDIEHFLITHYFIHFLSSLNPLDAALYFQSEKGEELFQRDFLSFLAPWEEVLQQLFYTSLSQFICSFNDQIEMIHLNGSDFHNYRFDAERKLPLIGEHLPLGFDQDGVKDRIDYGRLAGVLRKLPAQKDIPVVLEVWRKDPARFISEMQRSKQFLINYLNQ